MADITVIAGFVFARIVGLQIPTVLDSLHTLMLERPSVQHWQEMHLSNEHVPDRERRQET